MERDILSDLIKWKDSIKHKPLIVNGVRQCGKTYIIKEFGKRFFDDMVVVNFEMNRQYAELFESDLDPQRIIQDIGDSIGRNIVPGQTLLFLDEIQECPRAITAMKYFCELTPELHVICAGSLLGVALHRENNSFPVGKVERLDMYPMSFKEFVIAMGKESLIRSLSRFMISRPIPEVIHSQMKRLLKEYCIVGGMPEAVEAWIETRDIDRVEAVLTGIINGYEADFAKHSSVSDIPKIRMIWESIPIQIAKENNKFVFSHVKSGKRASDLEDALKWLVDAGVVYRPSRVEKPEIPLAYVADRTYFKVYMCDVGLLRVRAGLSSEAILNEDKHYVAFKGALTENYVLVELIKNGKDVYFWRSGNSAEVDFLYADSIGYIPVEVKSADNTQAKSLKMFCERYSPRCAVKLSTKNLAVNEVNKTMCYSVPLYLAWDIDRFTSACCIERCLRIRSQNVQLAAR